MSTEDLKAGWRRFVQASNKGKAPMLAVIDETCAPNIVFHGITGTETHGLNDFKQLMSTWIDAFTDAHMTIEDLVAEGDRLVVRYTLTGTHKGEFMGIPPTNKKVTLWVIEIDRVAGGKVVEGWSRADTLSLMQQLGVVPAPRK